jgi:hypothetical protein
MWRRSHGSDQQYLFSAQRIRKPAYRESEAVI